MNVATYLATFLRRQGVQHVFGLPGGENVLLLEALRRAGIEFVLVHHEAAAGYAADVTGQLGDRPGVCLATVGPGAANLLAPALAAVLERSPVLAITAEVDSSWRDRATHMRINLAALFGQATKGSFDLKAGSAVRDIEMAWQLAQEVPRGSVHLSLAPDVAAQTIQVPDTADQPSPSPIVKPTLLDRAQEHLSRARALIILAGLGLEASGAQSDLLALAEAWQVPVAVTPKAKGHFPESHPLFAGCFTAYGDQPLRQALAKADLILGVGLDGVDFVTSTWEFDTPVVNLACAGADDPVVRPVLGLNGPLRQLLQTLRPRRQPDPHGPKTAAMLRESIANALQTNFSAAAGTVGIHDLVAALRQVLPADGAITVDVGAFKLVLLQQWHTDRPKSLFVANGLSAMGYAIPGAIAIKLAQPQRRVVAVVGDGALLMYAGELATVARLGLPLVLLVVVDEALALIRLKQLRQSVAVHGTEFGRTDFEALARSFGLGYQLICEKAQAAGCLQEALDTETPSLVEARIDVAEYDHFK